VLEWVVPPGSELVESPGFGLLHIFRSKKEISLYTLGKLRQNFEVSLENRVGIKVMSEG
jgi:hypothetical protein